MRACMHYCYHYQVVAANGYSDVITLVQGKMEEVKLPGTKTHHKTTL
jgi:hypothetical protein